MRFRILDRYILKELGSSFMFGVLTFTTILVAGDLLFKVAELLIEKGISMVTVLKLFVYKLPSVVVITLPMSCLLSTLLSFGRLSSDSEIVALKASGISFQRIALPVLLGSSLIALTALFMNETVVPLANKAADNVLRYDVVKQKPSLLKERIFLKDESGGTLNRVMYIGILRARIGVMENVVVQEFAEGRLSRITTADRGNWEEGVWSLSDGKVFGVDGEGRVSFLFGFKNQRLPLSLTPTQVASSSQDPDSMSIKQLMAHMDLMKAQGANLVPLWVSFHLHLAVPWASVVLALIGAALGVRPQRKSGGMGMGFGLSVLIVFAYYVVMSMGRALGESGHIPPFFAAWLPNIIFLSCGGLLTARANR
ncbi:LPS export ABC transporter permease LptG [Dethiosulfovibrio salsuginis]|uniref:Lipopolysaccharide export system permease protein n=1 Tax=Dethiosulfovibrio salsuginis TaxID=561720 RepID=A0A1X7JPF6_9BACT|nr:LPS export ABC transporter permease LptG [Dethiosulfovibrio salsuginis]SMG29835.1 lipopolysaccharide export system permease protein [Dethiosulfovibrio salsuginis]